MESRPLAAIPGCAALLRCPKCHGGFRQEGGSLLCPQGHGYDIAAKGYVHLAPEKRAPRGYDAASFAARAAFLDAGYYDHVLEAALSCLSRGPVADAGCGEGWFAAHAAKAGNGPVVGLDLSKDAVRMAAARDKSVCWLVADLANMPLKSGSMEAVVNLFSPANYAEFRRVLKPGGLMIKAVPGPEHLRELRQLLGGLLPPRGAETAQAAEHFAKHMTMVERLRLKRTLPIGQDHAAQLLRMTPMLFDRDVSALSPAGLSQITVDVELLVGTNPREPHEEEEP